MELIEVILSKENLNRAYKKVVANKGAGGVDGVTVEELGNYIRKNREKIITSLRNRTYIPKPVRRVYIPKDNGKKRPLGIPTALDRTIQQAISQPISDIYEKIFSDYSYGFRPGNLWLLLPLMAGGFTGNLTFQYLHAGLQGPVSPGSVVTILLMAGKNTWLFVLAGLAVSTAVSFAGSLLVLKMTTKSNNTVSKEISSHDKSPVNNINEEKNMKIQRIAVICDGGVGTSAMGASILRRRLAQEKLTGIQVDAYAADLIPDGIDLIVCQKDLYDHLPEKLKSDIGPSREIYTAGSLLTAASYDGLVCLLRERGR